MKVAARGAALLVALAIASVASPARATDVTPEDTATVVEAGDAPPALVTSRPGATRAWSYPLVALLQMDAVMASEPQGMGPAAATDPPFGSSLRLRRLRLGEDVRAGAWRARVLLEVTSRRQHFAPVEGGRLDIGGPARLIEAFGAWTPHRAFQVFVGAQRVPFSLSRQVDDADLRLPERAQISTALAPDYRAGVGVQSDLGLLEARASLMSADPSVDSHLFRGGTLAALRLSAEPMGPVGAAPWRRRSDDPWYGWWRFSAGGSVLYGTLLVPGTLALGADAQLQWRRLAVTGEYLGEHLSTGPMRWPHQGAVIEPGVVVWNERLELTLRGAWYRQPFNVTADAGDSTDTFAGGAGLTLYLYEARVRLQAAFEARRTRDGLLADSSWGIFRATFTL